MKLKIPCAYCDAVTTLDFGRHDQEIRGRGGKLGPSSVKCHVCDSTFAIYITTKRKSKGKRLREREAKERANYETALAHARDMTKRLGDELLAQPGCTCKAWVESALASYYVRIRDFGHPLSTGTMRETWAGGPIPLKPEHRNDCPLSDSPIEKAARDRYDWKAGIAP